MTPLSEPLKAELVLYVLTRTPVWYFNICIKGFSVQRLYSRCKNDLKRDYPQLMPTELHYAVVMAEVFTAYKCCEVQCPALRHKIDNLKYKIKLIKKYGNRDASTEVTEHNTLVDEYSKLLEPQNRLIALYKKVKK